MPRRSRPGHPDCSTRDLCKLADVQRKHLDRIWEVIIDQAMDGRVVTVQGIGKFWIKEWPPRARRVINYKTNETRIQQFPTTYKLRFKVSANLLKAIQLRSKGRMAGTEVLV